jgi:hypothetical protein
MFKNGGIILKKRGEPCGVDSNSIILFLDENNKLCYKDDIGKIHILDSDLLQELNRNVVKTNEESTIDSNVIFNKDVYISGKLIVNNGVYELVTQKINLDNNFIELNSQNPLVDAGISINRGNGEYSKIVWVEANKKWYIEGEKSEELIGKDAINKIIDSQSSLNVSVNTFFGDGSDGTKEIDDIFELDRDYYFKNLRLNSGGNIKTNGFRLFVQDILLFNGGIISNNGNSSGDIIIDSNNYCIGGLGGIEVKSGSLGQSSPGGRGSTGTISDGCNTASTITLPINNGGMGGFGGNGGDGVMGKGGKSVNNRNSNRCIIRNVYLALQSVRGAYLINGGLGGDGGASGGGDGMYRGGGGGGGGSGGGVIQIIAKNVIITSNSSYPSIVSNGGDAGNGKNAINGNCGGGGGGSSGGGGYIQLFYVNIQGNSFDNFISVNPGIPGIGGKGNGSGTNGLNGGIGELGSIEYINVKTGEWNVINMVKG